MKLYHLVMIIVSILFGMGSHYFLLEHQYACKIDDFYGVAQCYRILNDEECNKDRNLLEVSTPYDERTRSDGNGNQITDWGKKMCVNRDGYTITKGIMEVGGFQF